MAEPEDIDVGEVGGDSPSPASDASQSEGFSIGKLIEWLLGNLIPVIIAVVISTIIMFIVVNTSVTKKSKDVYDVYTLKVKPEPLSVYPVGDFKINTADIDEPHFLRLVLSLGYDGKNKPLTTELNQRKAEIRDVILRILNSKTKSQLDENVDKERLKEEIKKSINNVLIHGEVQDVYYDEFVIS